MVRVSTKVPDPPGDAEDDSAAPSERVSHGSARSVLLTLLGEFLLNSTRQVRTSAILYVLEGLGIAEKSARQAIMRSAAAGWIESIRDGRQTSWLLTDKGRGLIASGSARLKSLRRAEWDGRWLILHLPLPETQKTNRTRIYRSLTWLGFGSLATALWINPHSDREAETAALLADMQLTVPANTFVGRPFQQGMTNLQMAERAWDMGSVLAHYCELTAAFGRMRPQTPNEVLFAHVQLVNQLQRLPFIDPGLPSDLLPPRFNTVEHASQLFAIRRSWSPTAHARWNELTEA